MRPTLDELRSRLGDAFPGATIELDDESHLHAGHEGAKDGAGHFRARLCSERFAGLNQVARHRLVYDCLRDWMPYRIHALSIDARSPDEAAG